MMQKVTHGGGEPGGGATRHNKGCMYAGKLQSYGVTGKTGILLPVTTPMSCNEILLKHKFAYSTISLFHIPRSAVNQVK